MGKGGRGQARRGSPGRKDERGAAGIPGAAEEAGQANRGKGGAHSEVLREGAASWQDGDGQPGGGRSAFRDDELGGGHQDCRQEAQGRAGKGGGHPREAYLLTGAEGSRAFQESEPRSGKRSGPLTVLGSCIASQREEKLCETVTL